MPTTRVAGSKHRQLEAGADPDVEDGPPGRLAAAAAASRPARITRAKVRS